MTSIKRRLIWDIFFGSVFVFSAACFFLSLKGYFSPQRFSGQKPVALKDDEFDPSLMRLNTMVKLEIYCDSFFAANSTTRSFPGIVSEVVRKKFYHGYSYYNAYTNPMASFAALGIGPGANAIVIADDIVKYPFAACSQQSIVGMDIFKRKGYKVRKVIMYDDVTHQGHFTFEVFYDNDWHFIDTNMEPDQDVLRKYNRPSVAFLNAHPEITAMAYRKKGPELFQRLLSSSKIGPVNKNPAPFASALQWITKYLNYFGWLVIGLFLVIRYKLRVRKPMMSFAWLRKRHDEFQPVKATTMQGREARA